MRKIPLAMLVYLGGSSRYLLNVNEGFQIHGNEYLAINIDSFLDVLKDLKFKVTLAASSDLQKLRKDFDDYPKDAKISQEDSRRLFQIMNHLEHTLRAEAFTMDAYVLSEKRFEAVRLVEAPESLLGPNTFRRLPRIAQLDMLEAGKCIGFGLPTAGAFHLLRATEDSLRSYYRIFVKRGSTLKATWGNLVAQLRAKKRRPKPNKTLLNHLDHLRKNFRNPTDHPDMVYDMDGVQDLLSLVIDVLNRVARELPDATNDWPTEPAGVASVMHGLTPDEIAASPRFLKPSPAISATVNIEPANAGSNADEHPAQAKAPER